MIINDYHKFSMQIEVILRTINDHCSVKCNTTSGSSSKHRDCVWFHTKGFFIFQTSIRNTKPGAKRKYAAALVTPLIFQNHRFGMTTEHAPGCSSGIFL